MGSVLRSIVAVLLLALAAATVRGEILEFNFTLDGSQEVPPVVENSAGAAQLLYDTDTQMFDLDLMVFGIALADLFDVGPNLTPVHIHMAPPGANGPVVVDLGYLGSFVDDALGIRLQLQDELFGGIQGVLETNPDDNEAALFAGDLYINVHTVSYPAGEVRGQIVPEPAGLGLLAAGGVFATLRRRR